MNEYAISEQKPLADEYAALRNAVGWGNLPLETAEGALEGAMFCVSVRYGRELVGFGRVVGDGCFTFYIQDIIIHPDHQRKGLGKAVMGRIMGYIESAGLEGAYIGLMAARGAVGFYEQLGFKTRPQDAPGMERRLTTAGQSQARRNSEECDVTADGISRRPP